MVPIQTKEHLIYFMQCGMMRLSKYDLHFMQNLHMLVTSKSPITTNQVALFEKIVGKYSRQLNKHGLTTDKLSVLTWETTVVPSDKKYTEAYITIENDKIYFRSPFNKKFLEKFNRITFNTFKWVRESKHYESDFSTEALKFIINISKDFYPVINYCTITSELLNTVEKFNARYWQPTLIQHQGRFIIAAINQHLDLCLHDVKLNDDPECLSILSTHGVKVDNAVTKNDPLLEFASSYFVEIDYTNLDNLITYLHAVKCDCVFIAGHGIATQYKRNIINKIKESNIDVDEKVNTLLDEKLKERKNPMVIFTTSDIFNVAYKFQKVIKMTNSLPINIK